jgi:hypothetical protein
MSGVAPAAYGLRLAGLQSARWLAVTGADRWPEVSIDRDVGIAGEPALDVDALVLRLRADADHRELVHPLLGRIGSQLALARGGDAMHAGAVSGAAGAWGIIGAKGAGKSTLLAALAAAGTPVVTDDVLVFANGTAMAGPRCIDLRPEADRFGSAVDVRPNDPRRRVSLPRIEAEHRLAGFIHLEWSDAEPGLEPLDHRAALERLLVLRSEKGYPVDPRKLLDLAALPTRLLRRPRSWDGVDATVALVQRLLLERPEGQEAWREYGDRSEEDPWRAQPGIVRGNPK